MSKKKNKSVAPVAPATSGEKQSAEALKAHKILLDQKQASAALETRHIAEISKLCREVIAATVQTGKVYLKLCLYIRENMVAPKLVTAQMLEMGFNKQVVSRVNKVANASDEVFSQFAASTIGFNKALDMARNPVQESLAASMGTDVTDIKAQVEELDKEISGTSGAAGSTPLTQEQKDEKMLKQFEQGAARALSAAASFGWKKERKVVGGNGYILTVRKDPKWRPAPAPDAVKAADVKAA